MGSAANSYDIGDTVELIAWALAKPTVGSIDAGKTALTVRDASGYAASDPILVRAAGPAGADLVTTVNSVAGNVLTLAAAAAATVLEQRVGKPTAATATVSVRKPDGSSVTPAPTASSPQTGKYVATVDPDQAGDWWYRVAFTGAIKAAAEGLFLVLPRRVP